MVKRIIILTLCAFIALSCFAGCQSGGKDKETAAETKAPPKNVDPIDFYGCWKYVNSDEWIVINENGTYEIYEVGDQLVAPTEYSATPEGLYLPKMEITLYYDAKGTLWTDDGLEMEKSELPK